MKSELLVVGADVLDTVLRLYNRTEESFAEEVETLKEWMRKQTHLPEMLDDKYVQNFLILNKCDVEKTKQRIDTYYTIRSTLPAMYDKVNPRLPNMCQLLDILYFVPLPKLTRDNYRVFFFKIRNKDLIDELEPHDILAHSLAIHEVRFREDCMLGDVLIFDTAGINFKYLMKMTPPMVYKMISIYQKVFSMPMKGLYMLNSTPILNTLMKIVKAIIKPKIFSRIFLCPNTSVLEEKFDKDVLPSDYGGEERSLDELQEILKIKFVQYQDRFDRLDVMRVNEKLRPKKTKSIKTLGLNRNFKKLELD